MLAALAVAFAPWASGDAPGRSAVASAQYLATEAGHEILAQGGNAFDAAIAVSSTLAVVEPESSGLGGGGFWLIHRESDGFQTMIDGRERAPGAAHRDMYLDEEGNVIRDLAVNGPLAAGIPGLAAGLSHLAEHYGRLPLAQSLQPALRLARNGYPVGAKTASFMTRRAENMRRWPAASDLFLVEGEPAPAGHMQKNPDIAWVLEQIAAQGHDGFYRGAVADKVVEGVREAGGIWTLEDMADYDVAERDPIHTQYSGYTLVTAPPPSSGGVAIAEILNIIEPFDLPAMSRVQRTHLIAEAMRRAYRDRALYLGDPDFYDVPLEMLTSQHYADGLRASILMERATPSEMLPGQEHPHEGTDTSHFSIMDAEGNMVAATQTVNLPFGSAFMAPGTGFLLNNEMDDFSAKPGEPNAYGLVGFTANEIQPGKRPLSSMSPTFMIGEDRRAAIGTPGGSRIITMVLLGILDFMEGNGPESWVAVPRFHHQFLPDRISAEPGAFSKEEQAALKDRGHTVEVRERTWGNMHGVMWDRGTGEVSAGSDQRWPDGRAIVK